MPMYKEPTPEQIEQERLYQEMGLTDEEYARIKEILKRRPNYTETGLYSAMWSEHCSYKSSKPVLKRFPTEGKQVLQGPGEGAGIVDIGDGLAVVFKMESHNRPSAVEPFQGAATGVGGILRDVFSMGARPIALLNSLRFGELTTPRVKYLLEQAVAGMANYGNIMGVPTVAGEVYFDACYEGNPLVNAMCVGLIEHDKIHRGVAKGVGNSVVYVGASTGRDGIHGATFSSEGLSAESVAKSPTVQAGDPFVEKLLLEACLELINAGLVLGIQDMGAAGLTSSSAEMASKAGNGIELHLDLVPQREPDMSAYELMLSESQERMLLVVEKGKEAEVEAICKKWGLLSAVIGRVTDDGQLRLIHHGEVVAEVPVDSLAEDAPVYHKKSKVPAYYEEFQVQPEEKIQVENLTETLHQLLASPTIASKEWLYRQFDAGIGVDTVVAPGSSAGVVRIRGTRKALAMSADCNSRYIYLDPEVGGAIAVAEAARNIVCSGGKPLAITDCLNFGSPDNPEIFWQFEKAVEGISAACRALGTPVISGNVSLSNERSGKAIYPTPTIGMVGLIEDVDQITTINFKQAEDQIILLGETKAEFGGSELQKLVKGSYSGKPPAIDLAREKEVQELTLELIRDGVVSSAHDVSEGGLAVALVESAISGKKGFAVEIDTELSPTEVLFAESQSRIVLSVRPEHVEHVLIKAEKRGVPATKLGRVLDEAQIRFTVNGQEVINTSLDEVESSWKDAIPCLLNPSC